MMFSSPHSAIKREGYLKRLSFAIPSLSVRARYVFARVMATYMRRRSSSISSGITTLRDGNIPSDSPMMKTIGYSIPLAV